jgi:hypothetical protein
MHFLQDRPLLCRVVVMGLVLQAFIVTAVAQDGVRWLPGDSNAVLAVDVSAAYKSPVAVQNQWAKRVAESFVAQEVFLPPSTRRVTVGAQLEFNAALEPVRQHIVMEMKAGSDLDGVASLTGGQVEKVGELRGLNLTNGRYVVEARPQQWLAVLPGGRQAALRWARSGTDKSAPLSTFLKTAVESVSEQYPIVVALDLADAVDPVAARDVLQDLPGTPLKGAALDSAAQVLSSVQGVVCRVHLGSNRAAQCRIEFGQSAEPLRAIAMPLVQAVLNRWGASLEDTSAWKSRVDGYALVFDGEVTATGLKRIMSIVHPPVVHADAATSPENTTSAIVAASRKYLNSVRHELDDLRATLKRTRDNHALWYERAGRTIDELPLKNVDQDLQQFGAKVSSSLRYQGQAERAANVRTGTRLAQTNSNTYFSGVGPYGGVYSGSLGNPTAIAAEGNEAAANVKFSEWKQIEDGLSGIRRTLTQRYNEDF